jgi:hypothetical protein
MTDEEWKNMLDNHYHELGLIIIKYYPNDRHLQLITMGIYGIPIHTFMW